MAQAKATLEGAELSLDGGRLIYHVTGLVGDRPEVVMGQALFAPGIQQKGEFHPSVIGVRVLEHPRLIEMRGNFAAAVEVRYGKDEGGGLTEEETFELDTRTFSEVTELDALGQPIVVTYNFKGFNADSSGRKPPQVGQVVKEVTLTTLRIVRRENALPIRSMYRHTGNVNSEIFMFFPAGYWLMSGYNASSDDGQETYIVGREFVGKRDGWLKGALYSMPDGTRPAVTPSPTLEVNPPRLRLATVGGNGTGAQREFNGYTIVRVQDESDFNDMGLKQPRKID